MTQPLFPLLLSPVEIAGLSLRNRIVMPPMVTAMEVGSEQFRAWYEARAKGGVGLIIMEATWVYRLLEDVFCEALRPTVDAIHRHGAPVVAQLFQPPNTLEGERFAPSAHANTRAVTDHELAQMPAVFAEASRRCQRIGFDGVEPHGAHGFFLNQMFSPLRNRRDGPYGGDLEGRSRLALEIISAIRDEVGEGFAIFYRHTAEEPGGYTVADSALFLNRLTEAGMDVADISPSTRGTVHADIAAEVRAQVGVPVIAVGGMEDPERAEAALREGKCDLCAVGRQLIADPRWPEKVLAGDLERVIACLKCDSKCFGNLGRGVPIGCAHNPESGAEYLVEA